MRQPEVFSGWLSIGKLQIGTNQPQLSFFSLPGVKFLPCDPLLLSTILEHQNDPLIPSKVAPHLEKHASLKTSPLPVIAATSAEKVTHAASAGEVRARVQAIVQSVEFQDGTLSLSSLPSEEEMSLLTLEERKRLCDELLPVVRKARPVAGAGALPPMLLLRGRIGGEKCRHVSACSRRVDNACPFQHPDDSTKPKPSPSGGGGSAVASAERTTGTSVYQRAERPRRGIIFVPVESAMSAEISFSGESTKTVENNTV